MKYEDFLKTKRFYIDPTGFDPEPMHESLFQWQRDVVTVAVKKGRYCLFTDTGTGKTAMECEIDWLNSEAPESEVKK